MPCAPHMGASHLLQAICCVWALHKVHCSCRFHRPQYHACKVSLDAVLDLADSVQQVQRLDLLACAGNIKVF